ncbi:MAG: O-antigen ligase family protein [Thermaerobacter sp.]|nr:O-antigen ligase family protein [Thermaerobacter sp.]
MAVSLPALPNWSQYIGPLALALILLVAASLRGLYFRVDQLYIGIAVLGIGAIALLFRRVRASSSWEISYADLAVFGFVLFSWLSVLWAVEPRLALQQAIVYSIAGVLYLYARSHGEGQIANALLLGLGGIAIASWLMAGAVWQYPAAVTVVDRLSGPFQYPDTAGAVYLATWLGATVAQLFAERRTARLLFGGLGGLAAYLFALTLSRGVWVVTPFAVIALLGVVRRGRRIGVLADVLVLGLLAFALAAKTFPHFNNVGSHYALLYGALAIILGAAIAQAIEWLHARGIDRWQVALTALLAILVLGGGALAYRARSGVALAGQTTVGLRLPVGEDKLSLQVSGSGSAAAQLASLDRFGTQTTIAKQQLQPGTDRWTVQVPKSSTSVRLLSQGQGSLRLDSLAVNGASQSLLLARAIPQSIYHRLLGISGTDLSVWERIDFWRDGMKMFAQSPILGWGGNAWQSIYQKYQSFNYSSNQAHSSLVDAAVSYGIFGIAFILLIAAALLFGLRRAWGKGDLAGASLVAGAALFLHSLIDFDLSIASSLLLLWLALGAMPQVRLMTLRRVSAATTQIVGGLLGALGIWVIVLSVAAGTEDALKPPTLLQLRQASALDPLSAQLHLELAQQELQQATSAPASSGLRASAAQDAAAAYRLNRNNQYTATLEAQMQIDAGNAAAALPTLRVAQQDQPMNPTMYQNYLDLATNLATQALGQHHFTAARRDLHQAWGMYGTFLSEAGAAAKVAPQNLQMPPATAQLQLYAGEAGALLGHTQTAVPLLKAASSGGQQAANIWLAALGAGSGKTTAAQYAVQTQWLKETGALPK